MVSNTWRPYRTSGVYHLHDFLAQAFTRGITKNPDGSRKIDVTLGMVKRFAGYAMENDVAAKEWEMHTAAQEAAKRQSENVSKLSKAKAGESSKPTADEALKEKAMGKGAKEVQNVEVVVKGKGRSNIDREREGRGDVDREREGRGNVDREREGCGNVDGEREGHGDVDREGEGHGDVDRQREGRGGVDKSDAEGSKEQGGS